MAAITTRQTTSAVAGVTNNNGPLNNTQLDTNFINLNVDVLNRVSKSGDTLTGTFGVKSVQNFISPNATKTISATMLDSGQLSWSGSAGQLFSITDSLTGTLFSVNDVSGIPSIEVLDTGLVKIAQYGGNTLFGTGVDNAADKVQVVGTASIVANSTNTALRITQVGTGDALRVEDSANPDATPMVIDASGRVAVGSTSALTYSTSLSIIPNLQVNAAGPATSGISRFSANNAGNSFWFLKSRGATVGDFTAVASGDTLGVIGWLSADGTDGIQAASISAQVDGTPSTNDMPGRLLFSTTADGASTPTERMRIDSAGRVLIGTTSTTNSPSIFIGKNITGSTNAYGVYLEAIGQSDVTGNLAGVVTFLGTASSNYNVVNLTHYSANQNVLNNIAAGGTVTNQYGFTAASNLTGATNNYGFYSNIPSAANRWNFYAAGTADNYFAGNVGVGATSAAWAKVTTGGTYPSGNNYSIGNYAIGTVPSTSTTEGVGYWSELSTQAASFSTTISHFVANQGALGAGSTVTTQHGFRVSSNLIGAANNFGVVSNIPDGVTRTVTTVARTTNVVTITTSVAHGYTTGQSVAVTATTNTSVNGTFTITGTPTTTTFTYNQTAANIVSVADTGSTKVVGRWNFHAAGTADNYFNTRLLLGRTYSSNERLGIGGSTSATGESGIFNDTTVGSATTTVYTAFNSYISTAAASFTLGNLTHYKADQFTIGAGSTVTNQYGFFAANLTGGTNNFGFHSNVASGTGRWNFYAAGTADNYFAGNLMVGGTGTEKLIVVQSADIHTARFVNSSTSGAFRGLQVHSTANNIPGVTLSRWYSTFAGNADVGQIRFDGLGTGAGYVEHAGIYAVATAANTATGAPTKLSFKTSDGTSSTEKMAVSATGIVNIVATTASTSTTTGALVVSGGIGVGENSYFAKALVVGTALAQATALDLNNNNIVGINALTFADPGPNEGISFNGNFNIYESPDDLGTNTAGNIQFVSGGVRRLTVKTTGQVEIPATTASTSTTTGALIVAGGVGIAGALNATTKSFIINHPTKPGKLLRHGSLEGPEFGVYVRGRLDNNNMIVLPEYWTKLVDSSTITVNLTPIGSHQELYVEDIVNNLVFVKNSNLFNKTINCFYTVFGERVDVDKLEVET